MHLTFNEGSGNQAGDSSGNSNHGSIQGSSWETQGIFGTALSFDGVNDGVLVADSASLDLSSGMTLEAWIKPAMSGAARFETVLMKETSDNLAYTIYSRTDLTNQAASAEITTNSGWVTARNPGTISAGVWSHIASTYDGTTLRLYINGQQRASYNSPGAITQSEQPLRIGFNSVWGEAFQGVIDEVRVYNRALSAQEILYDMGDSGQPLPGTLFITPADGYSASGPAGGPFAPVSKQFTLTNIGSEAIDFSAIPNQNWIGVSPQSGTLSPSASADIVVTLASSTASFPIGNYQGGVNFSNTTNGNGSSARQVSLVVYDPNSPSQTCTSITDFDITWTFNAPYPCGQYVNGDWWVVAPQEGIIITDIQTRNAPHPSCNGANARSGTEVNPRFEQNQGLDGRSDHFLASKCKSPPFAAFRGDTVLSSQSLQTYFSSKNTWMDSMSALTIVDIPQAPNRFRPPIVRNPATRSAVSASDHLSFSTSQIDWQQLEAHMVSPVSGTPSLAEINDQFPRFFIDNHPGGAAGYLYPSRHGFQYGRESSEYFSEVSLMLLSNSFSRTEKQPMMNRFIQIGIDLWGHLEDPFSNGWPGNAGIFQGRKWPIIFAGIMLNHPMKNIGTTHYARFDNGHVKHYFAEDSQTYFYDDPSLPELVNRNDYTQCYTPSSTCVPARGVKGAVDKYNGGQGDTALWRIVQGPEYGDWGIHEHNVVSQYSDTDPYYYQLKSEAYRHCCWGNGLVGSALAARLMNAVTLWNHPPFFAYMDRWMTQNETPFLDALQARFGDDYGPGTDMRPGNWASVGSAWGQYGGWVERMWEAHR